MPCTWWGFINDSKYGYNECTLTYVDQNFRSFQFPIIFLSSCKTLQSKSIPRPNESPSDIWRLQPAPCHSLSTPNPVPFQSLLFQTKHPLCLWPLLMWHDFQGFGPLVNLLLDLSLLELRPRTEHSSLMLSAQREDAWTITSFLLGALFPSHGLRSH